MIVEKEHQDYQIWELAQKRESGNIRLRWRFKEASDFVLFIYDSRHTFDLKNAAERAAALGMGDMDIMDSVKAATPLEKDGSLKLAHVRKTDFMRSGKCFRLPAAELKRDIPYGISVYACRFDLEEQALHIYQTNMQNNTCFWPVEVQADIQYKHEFFSKADYCILRLPPLEEYRDGAVMYRVDGINRDFPLPQSCLGKELVIAVPRRAEVNIRIREEDQKYYKKR